MLHARNRIGVFVLAAVAAATVSTAAHPRATAQRSSHTTLRLAIPGPAGLGWSSTTAAILSAWRADIARQSGGTLRMSFEDPQPESVVVSRVSAHQSDGAMLTGVGLAQLAPATLALELPGLCPDHATWDRVRSTLDTSLAAELGRSGLDVIAWIDRGQERIFSGGPVAHPSSLAGLTVWYHGPDPVIEQFIRAAGARPSLIDVDAVDASLSSGAIDAVVLPADGINVAWSRTLHFTTDAPGMIATGAIIIDHAPLASLSPRDRTVFDATIPALHRLLDRNERRVERTALANLARHGVQAVDPTAATAAWSSMQAAGRAALVGQGMTRQQIAAALSAAQP
jgi:TRAP-type C4-dicarboxylate transport system substrate-binding protein